MSEFKAGDLVVCTVGSYLPIFTLKKSEYFDDDFVIKHDSDEFGMHAYAVEYPYSEIRHATPEEIKAGKRLP